MLISLKDYPQFATAHQLVAEFNGAVIAGGLPRDLLTGKEYRDVDIFIPTQSTEHLVEMTIQAAKFANENGMNISVAGYETYGSNIIRIRLEDGLMNIGDIDLCFAPGHSCGHERDDTNMPATLLSTFDFVCCQAWMQRTEEGFIAHATPLFHELNERKVLGFYPHKGDLESIHAMKVLAKYNDYLLLELAEPKKPVGFGCDANGNKDIPF